MRAAIRDRYGPPSVVHLEHVPTPVPTGDEVLVRVHAASINRADLDGLYPRWQFTRAFTGVRRPRSRRLGSDVAGVVEAVGPRAVDLRVGDRVFSDLSAFGLGAFADAVCAPERAFVRLPDDLSCEVAATLPHSAVLAIQGLRFRDGRTVRPGDRVLVAGASGNVGPFAVQVARARGAIVAGAARATKLDFVRSLGAEEVIDYAAVDWTRGGARYDWIIDTEARHSVVHVRRALRPGGAYVSLGGPTALIFDGMLLGPLVSRASGRRMSLLTWWKPFDREDVATVLGLVAEGAVVPVIDRRFALEDIVGALRYSDSGQGQGKVLVIP